MIVLGLIFLALCYVFHLGEPLTCYIGWIALLIGLVLLVMGMVGRGVGGRRYWY